MSRTIASRLAAAGVMTLTTALAGLVLAPSASAAGLPALDLSETEVKSGQDFVVSGTGCFTEDISGFTAFAAVTTDEEESDILVVDAEPDGSWAVELAFLPGAAGGVHEVFASCNSDYNGTIQEDMEEEYPVATITVTGEVGAIRGVEANTPGTKSVTTDKTVTSSAPGQKVVRVIEGFQPFEVVTLVMHSTPVVLGTFKADANGVLTAEFTLPAGAPAGSHTLVYEGTVTYFQESFTVTAAGKLLAATGADIAVPLTVGLGLVAAGVGALVVSRRRNTEAAPQI
jgi:hypothetical protein